MFKKMVPVTRQRHAGKKVMPVRSFEFAAKTYIASLITSEFNKVASAYPIVFVNDKDELKPFALFGLKQGDNLFVDDQGRWNAHYIPAIIRRYPFVLGRSEEGADLMLCIDEDSGFLSDTEGEPLFDDQGNAGQVIEKARNFLIELQRSNEMTNFFARELTKRDLLSPLKMQIRNTEGNMINIEGVSAVNETRLREIPDEDFLEMRKRGILPLIYAHLVSLIQIERLVQMQTERGL